MHRKGRQDAKRAKIFAKLGKELSVAARGGTDPDFNPRLRLAVAAAKAQNMPNDNISRAIQKGSGAGDSDNLEEIMFEAYGPSGVAILISTLTDNRVRTVANVKHLLNKGNGSMAAKGAVSYLLVQSGTIDP